LYLYQHTTHILIFTSLLQSSFILIKGTQLYIRLNTFFIKPWKKKYMYDYNIHKVIKFNIYDTSFSFNSKLGIPADIGNTLSVSGHISSPFIIST